MMGNDSYLDTLRGARNKPAVIKLKFMSLKSRSSGSPIFVFEGDEDKIVYGRWISRIVPLLNYDVFICNGKRGIRALDSILAFDVGKLKDGTFMFVDRDFDDLDGFIMEENVFLLDRFSIENYLVSCEVLNSLLRDEFPLHDQPLVRELILEQFDQDYVAFLDQLAPVNWRIFLATRAQCEFKKRFSESISDYACVSYGQVAAGNDNAESLIQFDIEEDESFFQSLKSEFDRFIPEERYRGKFAIMFFHKWLLSLAEHLSNKSGPFEGVGIVGKARQHEFTLGTFASKSILPDNLEAFLSRASA
jgi:hypothetical protein